KRSIGMKELEESIDRVIAGPERKSRLISEKEKKIVACHESGHALIAFFTEGSDPVHKISIMPRGIGSLGYTLQLPIEDKYLVTKSEILGKMSILLGGRCAEEIIFSDVTTGAQNDLEKVTEIARRMVTEYGMSELGPVTFGRGHGEIFLGRDFAREKNYSEESAAKIDKEIVAIISAAHKRANELISKNKEKLKALSESLIEKEVLEKEDVERILKNDNTLAK
ncbi:cell division protein FtsH, partial [bacterium]|nr:cell division protein FtsH [bacterium]